MRVRSWMIEPFVNCCQSSGCDEKFLSAVPRLVESGRGQPHSTTSRKGDAQQMSRSVVECGCPLPLSLDEVRVADTFNRTVRAEQAAFPRSGVRREAALQPARLHSQACDCSQDPEPFCLPEGEGRGEGEGIARLSICQQSVQGILIISATRAGGPNAVARLRRVCRCNPKRRRPGISRDHLSSLWR